MLEFVARAIVPAAYELLPDGCRSDAATAMMLAIGLQESGFQHRRQLQGPARGFWQFEGGGIRGVLGHRASREAIRSALVALGYRENYPVLAIREAITHNDVLACVFARLLLWTDPEPLPPSSTESVAAWDIYYRTWRPGKPHPQTWGRHYSRAWAVVERLAAERRQDVDEMRRLVSMSDPSV